MSNKEKLYVFILSFVISYSVSLVMSTYEDVDIKLVIKAQETCIKANSKAVSFDRIQVTCENKAVIPFGRD